MGRSRSQRLGTVCGGGVCHLHASTVQLYRRLLNKYVRPQLGEYPLNRLTTACGSGGPAAGAYRSPGF